MAGAGQCKVPNPAIEQGSLENNQNMTNTPSTRGNSSIISGSQQSKRVHTYLLTPSHFNERNECVFDSDNDITCDVTMPVMSEIYSGSNPELISSTVISPEDIVMDDTVAANKGLSSYSDDIRTIADTEITNAISGENIHSDRVTMHKSKTDQYINNEIDNRQEKIEQRPCVWSHIDTDFDPE